MIAKKSKPNEAMYFTENLLEFTEGVLPNKSLKRLERYANIRNHLRIKNKELVKGQNILIMDDVCTTGATLYYCRRYLLEAGALEVKCMSLSQTIY